MLYQFYQLQDDLIEPWRQLATALRLDELPGMKLANGVAHHAAAAMEMVSRYRLTHERPDFGIRSVPVGNREVPVVEEVALDLPFGKLLHFAKDVDTPQPPVLVVAPLSGHFATLLRNTVEVLLRDHDVYITD